jgi:formylmethanofuran dehydrogenase subunit B
MAVAWIGNREMLVERAAEHAAELLDGSRCPVFSFDTDIHGTRAAIALAERVGAAYDHMDGAALAREVALFTDSGGMMVSPGEVRRRADLVAIAGELPAVHHGFVAELADTAPDLSAKNKRAFFVIGGRVRASAGLGKTRATRLSCGDAGLAATLAAVRARYAGRQVAAAVSNFDRFAEALEAARFPVFLFSGLGADGLALEMLQGLIADLNRNSRASGLHLPASESGWGSSLASTWMTGFPTRTGFARGLPEFDPWRFDVARILAAGEADIHLCVATQANRMPARRNGPRLIALAKTAVPVRTATITIAIGEPGIDHNSVAYSGRTGTLTTIGAQSASAAPSAASVIRMIGSYLRAGAELPC